jgi:spore coat protein CotH
VYRGKHYYLEAKFRGASSFGYPKKSLTLKFPNEDRFQEPLLGGGFVHKRKVTLTTTFDDNSYIRQRLAFTLWNLLDSSHLQVQNYSAVVFVNGQYRGLYNITDHIDQYFVEQQGLHEDGNLYKAVNHDGNFSLISSQTGNPKTSLHAGYEKKNGVAGDFSDLDQLVSFVATAPEEEFQAQLGSLIDQKEFEDWWIFVSFIQADDSAGKNSYLYHDPRGGLWRYVPWDFNDSTGQTWQTARKDFDRNPADYSGANFLFARLLANDTFGPALEARYQEVLHNQYDLPALLQLVDSMTEELRPSALRDERLWGEAYQSFGGWSFRGDYLSFEEESAYVRSWLESRWNFVTAE